MVGISGGVGSGGGGYNYVQDAQPGDPSEGEEWYDTGANAAYVYDGASWVEQTVVDHGQLSGVGTGDHHTRYTDAEAAGAALQYVALFQGINAHKQRYTYDTSDLGSATVEYRCDPNGSAGFTVYENGSQVADASSSSGTNTTISTSFTPSSGVNSYTLSINRPDNGGAEYWLGGWLEP